MSTSWEADALITSHSNNVDRYKRNFLKQAVCELRFPTLMELGDPKPPVSLVNALRKEYPHLELSNEVTLGIGSGVPGSNNAHIFRSSKLTWAITLKQSVLSIETTSYTDYANMRQRVLNIIAAATPVLDTDFFTRVGLRYVNVIDSPTDPTQGWVNETLVSPILFGKFIGIQEFAGKLQLATSDGGCLLQHGIRLNASQSSEDRHPEYVLDVDTYRNDVKVEDISIALDKMHEQAFDLFDWALGENARNHLSQDRT